MAMESVIVRSAEERQSGVAPNKIYPGLVKPVTVKLKKGSVKAACEKLSFFGVLGEVDDYSPSEKEIEVYVEEVVGKKPDALRPKSDGSFHVWFKQQEDAEKLIASMVPFPGMKTLVMESWAPQKDIEKTEFYKKFVWVQLPGLREEFFEVAAELLVAVGEVVIKTFPEEFWAKQAKPRFGVRVNDLSNLPEGLIIKVAEEEGEDEEEVYQPLDYPDLPTCYRLCGSTEHLQQSCTAVSPWKTLVLGETSESTFVPGFGGGSSSRPLVMPASNSANIEVCKELAGTSKLSAIVVMKVGMILIRGGALDDEIRISTQSRRTASALWNISGLLRA